MPGGDFRAGEIEELPHPAGAFDVVAGFNAFRYAGDLGTSLREAWWVVKAGGRVAMVTRGMPQDCEHATTLRAVGALYCTHRRLTREARSRSLSQDG